GLGDVYKRQGLGYPNLVPIATSDFIFTAIAEESGLTGSLALLTLFALLTARGLLIGLRAPDRFRRLLALGLTTYLAGQSILIIGGNVRLLPLTGVTLPFMSYGGSSLLTSLLSLLLLVLISNQGDEEPAPLNKGQPILLIGASLGLGLLALAVLTGWWVLGRGPTLLNRTDNPRRAIAERYVRRGALLDRRGQPINQSEGEPGALVRRYLYPNLSSVVGYTHFNYGQTGLEASLDPYLRGLQGNPASTIWLHRILYGQPPPGLDIRLSLDLELQKQADALLGMHSGAIVLLNAETGEILAIASHPTYDANRLDEIHGSLLTAPETPLLNRATQVLYPVGSAVEPFRVASGLSTSAPRAELEALYQQLGFYSTPQVRLPAAAAVSSEQTLQISPLQMALAAASLSHEGIRPAGRLVLAVHTLQEDWVILPPQDKEQKIFTPAQVAGATRRYALAHLPCWQFTAQAKRGDETFTWSFGGTLPDWQGAPLAIVMVLEKNAPALAQYLVQEMLRFAIAP
ncbi:MAG: FtsW/RodA/SpoVE family cell cycle protein, partial [Anaerolineales bacterium]|nr:FtsW/RodA/SpoVE family cell cycle protein [Anaerolineales bacterium]